MACLLFSGALLMGVAPGAAADSEYRQIEFADLLPDEDYEALSNPPEELADVAEGSMQDQMASAIGQAVDQAQDTMPKNDWERALQSTNVRPEFDGQKIRMAGFLVPLEFDDNQVVTEFFLVPYYGACIHLPPPPPNQIVLVKSEKGVQLDSIYDPFWVEGTLAADLKENEVAKSAYSMQLDKMTPYLDKSRR
ncbi:MAG: hypothetical protein CMI02_08275 [Oceanospirillaceae bacterium]|nr:hypothetical protein [Oceanospirillaceae bacterium]MBT12017.1 hypothetical protein [Oceanospirillaceae bacterium]|tara:strand:- start:105271 stop:105849 length:579 start_codon:yes stop_codon:yes gene_type:complete